MIRRVCSGCHSVLDNRNADAGKRDQCPVCGVFYRVGGTQPTADALQALKTDEAEKSAADPQADGFAVSGSFVRKASRRHRGIARKALTSLAGPTEETPPEIRVASDDEQGMELLVEEPPVEEPPPPPVPAATASDPLDRLAKLGELHNAGVLTDEEFAEQKAKLLANL